MRTAAGDLVIYASEQCHYSIDKSADILGLGRNAMRKIPTDKRFHIDLEELREAIGSDRDAGRVLCCIVGVAGTTSTGVIDPLEELAANRRGNRLLVSHRCGIRWATCIFQTTQTQAATE